MQQAVKQLLPSDVARQIDPGGDLSVPAAAANECSQYSCDLLRSLHRGLQSRAI